MKKINTLIVGQGIAGTLVAYMLHLQKIPFIVIDPVLANTSSRIAAGMFTPISGKRKTIAPLVTDQIAFAIQSYEAMERLAGINFLHLLNVYQVYHLLSEKLELNEKLQNPDFAKFIIPNPDAMSGIKQETGAFEITHSGWLDCELMINGFTQWLKQNDSFIEDGFLYTDLQIGNEVMEYHDLVFKHIVFCEGYKAVNNPFFNKENIIPCKGDMLTIKYEKLATDRIIKRNGIYLIPTGNSVFRAGATYRWNNDNDQPDEPGKLFIESQLETLLENSFETIHHKAAIRPTTHNREVIAKQHTEHRGMFMLNGLGSRGVLQGPWWARHIVKLVMR